MTSTNKNKPWVLVTPIAWSVKLFAWSVKLFSLGHMQDV